MKDRENDNTKSTDVNRNTGSQSRTTGQNEPNRLQNDNKADFGSHIGQNEKLTDKDRERSETLQKDQGRNNSPDPAGFKAGSGKTGSGSMSSPPSGDPSSGSRH